MDALNSTSSMLEQSFSSSKNISVNSNSNKNSNNVSMVEQGNISNGGSNGVAERGEEERMTWLQR